jgi:hypothetical protein
MKGFTGKTQKIWRSLHVPITGKKKKLAEFTFDLLLPFYLNRYSGGVYNYPVDTTYTRVTAGGG